MNVDWKPDKNKNCEKCIEWDNGIYTDEYGGKQSDTPHCTFALSEILHKRDNSLKNREFDFKYQLGSIINNLLEHERDEGCCFENDEGKWEFDKNFWDSYHVFLANICPLYKEEE